MSEFGAGVPKGEKFGLTGTSTADNDEICIDLLGKFKQHSTPRARR